MCLCSCVSNKTQASREQCGRSATLYTWLNDIQRLPDSMIYSRGEGGRRFMYNISGLWVGEALWCPAQIIGTSFLHFLKSGKPELQIHGWSVKSSFVVGLQRWLIWTTWCNCGGWGMRLVVFTHISTLPLTSFHPFLTHQMTHSCGNFKEDRRQSNGTITQSITSKMIFFFSFHLDFPSYITVSVQAH